MADVMELWYTSATGTGNIYAKLTAPQYEPWAIVQLAHGMAEHIERYDHFTAYLAENGLLVAANDHAGHGKSIGENGMPGYFGAKNGWANVIADMLHLQKTLIDRYNKPIILLGHSMGSFLARTVAAEQGSLYDGYIFLGTAGSNPAVAVGRVVAKAELKRHGERVPSRLLHKMSFGKYNVAFSPARTPNDWLSRDEAEVDKYCADDLCGFMFTAEAMLDLFDGLDMIDGIQWAKRVPNVPIMLASGTNDPVGGSAKGVRQVYKNLKQSGHDKLKLKLYEGCRHELINEINKYEIYSDILDFLRGVV